MNKEEESIWNLIAILMKMSIEDLEVLRPIWIEEVKKAGEKEAAQHCANELINLVIQSKRNESARTAGTI
ncbi:MAG: hypothetical protein H6Q69_510 [Firmicutes bacterium]|nr:hypothetical protein [Bacillota bacterium]